MRKPAHQMLLLTMFTTLAIALNGCGSSSEQETISSKHQDSGDKADASSITVGILQDLDSLDPHLSQAAGTREVLFNVFEGLVKPDENGDLKPAVASAWTVSKDAKTILFTLRDGVKFHDGSNVTAEDVKYSLERCAGTKTGKPLVSAFSNVKEVKMPDNRHIELVLKQPDADFITNCTAAIVPKKDQELDKQPIGTGPYQFVSRSPQEKIVMKKFDDYWDPTHAASIRNLTWKIESDADSLVMDMEAGSVDLIARLTPEQVGQLSDQFQIYEGTMNLVQALYLNNAVKPFQDKKVRQALCYAVDVKQIMDFVSNGKGSPIGSSMYPSFRKYFIPELANKYPHDPEKAKSLLAQAGYPNGFSFTITVASNYDQHIETAQVIAQELKEVGIKADIQEVEWNSWLEDVYNHRKYEATVIGVDASTLSASSLLSRFVSSAPNNFINFHSDSYDETYQKAESAVQEQDRTSYFKKCETILSDEAANVYLQDLPSYVALNKKFTGYTFFPLYAQDIARIKPAS